MEITVEEGKKCFYADIINNLIYVFIKSFQWLIVINFKYKIFCFTIR